MKAPSKNISTSLSSQRSPGRGPIEVSQSGLRPAVPSMTVPGEGRVSQAPGANQKNPRLERSAANFANAMNGKVG